MNFIQAEKSTEKDSLNQQASESNPYVSPKVDGAESSGEGLEELKEHDKEEVKDPYKISSQSQKGMVSLDQLCRDLSKMERALVGEYSDSEDYNDEREDDSKE